MRQQEVFVHYAPNIRTLEAYLIGDKRYDKTYKSLPPPASESKSDASIPSVIYDEDGNNVIVVDFAEQVSVNLDSLWSTFLIVVQEWEAQTKPCGSTVSH